MKKAIVTGATGYIGSNLCKQLIKEGWKVAIVTRPTSDYNYLSDVINKIEILEYDDNLSNLISFFNKVKASVVFHLAAVAINEHDVSDVDILLNANIRFGLHILEAMKQSSTPFLINTGTYWQHFESDEYNPLNLYAATKQSFQDLVKYYTSIGEIKAITLKLFDTYGPNDDRPKLINLLHKFADEGIELDMSPGEQQLDYVHIDDITQAFIKAYEYIYDIEEYEEFAVATGRLIQLKELVQLFKEKTGKEIKVNWGGKPYRKREVLKPWSSYRTLPNWNCEKEIEKEINNL